MTHLFLNLILSSIVAHYPVFDGWSDFRLLLCWSRRGCSSDNVTCSLWLDLFLSLIIHVPSFVLTCHWALWCPRVRPMAQYPYLGLSSPQLLLLLLLLLWEDFCLSFQSGIVRFGMGRIDLHPTRTNLLNPTSGRDAFHSCLISLWPKNECTTTTHTKFMRVGHWSILTHRKVNNTWLGAETKVLRQLLLLLFVLVMFTNTVWHSVQFGQLRSIWTNLVFRCISVHFGALT